MIVYKIFGTMSKDLHSEICVGCRPTLWHRGLDSVENLVTVVEIALLRDIPYHTLPYSFNNLADIRNLQQYCSIEHYPVYDSYIVKET